jgi:hypothetical protein
LLACLLRQQNECISVGILDINNSTTNVMSTVFPKHITTVLLKMFIFVKRHFTIFFEAQHSTRTTVWIKIWASVYSLSASRTDI